MVTTHAGNTAVERAVRDWLQDVVIGLNLCPFASKPARAGQVRYCVSDTSTEQDLLADLLLELQRLDKNTAHELETTLLIIPHQLTDFADYNQFLDLADWLLQRHNYDGTYQLASFHPDYQFADTEPDDAENLTNRAPYPILHLLREESLEQALTHYANPESIPEHNIQHMQSLGVADKKRLFPYLFANLNSEY